MPDADISITRPIAKRELDLIDWGKILVALGEPFEADEKGEEFWCQYQIIGIGSGRGKKAMGGDSLQALCLMLYSISNELYASEEFKSGKLKWEGGMRASDLGTPISEAMAVSIGNDQRKVDLLA